MIPEENCLKTPPREVEGAELLALIDCTAGYHVYDRIGRLVQVIDPRRAQVLMSRKLLVGKVNKKGELTGFITAPGVTASQIKTYMRLKPPSISICNRATVEEVGPGNFWHRSILRILGKRGATA